MKKLLFILGIWLITTAPQAFAQIVTDGQLIDTINTRFPVKSSTATPNSKINKILKDMIPWVNTKGGGGGTLVNDVVSFGTIERSGDNITGEDVVVRFGSVTYGPLDFSIPLDPPADDSTARIDRVVVNSDSSVSIITGTPSISPIAPGWDKSTQLSLGLVFHHMGGGSGSGSVLFATQAEVDAGVNTNKAVNSVTLNSLVDRKLDEAFTGITSDTNFIRRGGAVGLTGNYFYSPSTYINIGQGTSVWGQYENTYAQFTNNSTNRRGVIAAGTMFIEGPTTMSLFYDRIQYKYSASAFTNLLFLAPTALNRTLYFPDQDGTLATLSDISAAVDTISSGGGGVGVTDGNKGDITVSGSGTNWQINANAVGPTEIASGSVGDGHITGVAASKVTGLATVAISGSYSDLGGRPTISGSNTGDETTTRINALYGYTPANPLDYYTKGVADSRYEPAISTGTTAQYLDGTKVKADFGSSVRKSTIGSTTLPSSATVLAPTDSIPLAFGKIKSQLQNVTGAMGDIFNHTFDASSSSLFTRSGISGTWSYGSGGLNISGTGTNAPDNSIQWTNWWTDLENNVAAITFTPNSDGNFLGLGFYGSNSRIFYASITLTGANKGQLNYSSYIGTTITNKATSGSTLFSVTNGQSHTLSLTRTPGRMYVTIINNVTGVQQQLIYNNTFDTVSGIDSYKAGRMAIVWGGGDQTITNFTYKSLLQKNLDLLLVGDSNLQGAYAGSNEARYAIRLAGAVLSKIGIISGAGNTSADIINLLPEILAAQPRAVYINIGSNDPSQATNQTNLTTIINTLTANNIRVIIGTVFPQTSSNATIDAINTWIKSSAVTSRCTVIDFDATLKDGGSVLSTLFSSGDVVHLNAAGNYAVFQKILTDLNAYLITSTALGIQSGYSYTWTATNNGGVNHYIINSSTSPVAYSALRINSDAVQGLLASYSSNNSAGKPSKFEISANGNGLLLSATVSGSTVDVLAGGSNTTTNKVATFAAATTTIANNLTVTGTTLHTGAITGPSSTLNVTGQIVATGNIAAPSFSSTSGANNATSTLTVSNTSTGTTAAGRMDIASTGGNLIGFSIGSGWTTTNIYNAGDQAIVATGTRLLLMNQNATGSFGIATGGNAASNLRFNISAAGNTRIGSNTAATERLDVEGNVWLTTAGNKLKIKSGTNASVGTATLSAGTATISTTAVAANSIIFLTVQSLGTVTAPKTLAVTTKTAGTSFVITSEDVTDTSTVAWWIVDAN